MEDGVIVLRTSGTPQGGVVSLVIANLFMHYVFDYFMIKEFRMISWVRYVDDGIITLWVTKTCKISTEKIVNNTVYN